MAGYGSQDYDIGEYHSKSHTHNGLALPEIGVDNQGLIFRNQVKNDYCFYMISENHTTKSQKSDVRFDFGGSNSRRYDSLYDLDWV